VPAATIALQDHYAEHGPETLVAQLSTAFRGRNRVWFRFTGKPGATSNAGFRWFQFTPVAAARDVVLEGSSTGSSRFYLRATGGGRLLEVWSGGAPGAGVPVEVYDLAGVASLTINGGAGGDTALTFDASNGAALPPGLHFNPSAAAGTSSSITVIGTPGDDNFHANVGGSFVSLNWSAIQIGRGGAAAPVINYRTGGGKDSLGLSYWTKVNVLPEPAGGPILLSSVTLAYGSRLNVEAGASGACVVAVDELSVANNVRGWNPQPLGILDLQGNALVIRGHVEIVNYGWDIATGRLDVLGTLIDAGRNDLTMGGIGTSLTGASQGLSFRASDGGGTFRGVAVGDGDLLVE
jgi:hypothetical protein